MLAIRTTALTLIVLLSACNQNDPNRTASTELVAPPVQSMKCNDQEAKDLAREIIKSKIDNYGWFRDFNVSVSNMEVVDVRTLSRDEELRQYSCGANFSYHTNGGNGEAYFEYHISFLEDKGESEVAVDFKKVIPSIMSSAIN